MKKIQTKSKKIPPIKQDQNDGGLFSFVKTMLAAVICAAIVRSFFFEPFHIPSSSMKPGLLIGDYIFVSKYSYGYSKYSFPFSLPLFNGRILQTEQPKRGDVIVFRLPSNPSINYIKRLIGFPGDRIQVTDGILYVNQEAVSKEPDGVFNDQGSNIAQFQETLPEGKKFVVLDQFHNTPQDNTGVYVVPEGYYFMMGDNRDNSQDSRFLDTVGYIPQENLVGKARIIFFSSSQPFWQFWHWFDSIRFSRIFKRIS